MAKPLHHHEETKPIGLINYDDSGDDNNYGEGDDDDDDNDDGEYEGDDGGDDNGDSLCSWLEPGISHRIDTVRGLRPFQRLPVSQQLPLVSKTLALDSA